MLSPKTSFCIPWPELDLRATLAAGEPGKETMASFNTEQNLSYVSKKKNWGMGVW